MRPIVCSGIPFAMMNRGVQESMLKHPQCAQLSIAKASTGLDDLLQDRLQAFRSSDGPQYADDRLLLALEVGHPPSKAGGLRADTPHPPSVRPARGGTPRTAEERPRRPSRARRRGV